MTADMRAMARRTARADTRFRRRVSPRTALWSVYYHTTPRVELRPSNMPAELQPLPLREALRVLRDPWDRHQTFRRREALLKLVAAGFYTYDGLRELFPADEARAVHRQVSLLAEAIDVNIAKLSRLDGTEAVPGLYRLFEESQSVGPIVSIVDEEWSPRITVDPVAGTTTIDVSFRVNQPLGKVAKLVDPRFWDECGDKKSNDVFLKTCWIDDPQDCPPPLEKPESRSKQRGEHWKGFLYEKVDLEYVVFENILAITKFDPIVSDRRRAEGSIDLEYRLHRSEQTDLPLYSIIGGLEVDNGFTRAKPVDEDWTRLTMRKTVRFADLSPGSGAALDWGNFLNYNSPTALGMWVEYAPKMGLIEPSVQGGSRPS